MANLLLLADIASKTSSKSSDVGVQTDDIVLERPQHTDLIVLERCQQKNKAFLGFEPAPFGHDYIKQNDFDILVNANHDYYNRIPQTDEDLEHSYAFSVAQCLADADCSAPLNNYNVDDVFFEGIANLDEHMGIQATTLIADSSVFEEIVQEETNVIRMGGVELEPTLFSDVVHMIEKNKLHFDDILRYVNVDSEHVSTLDVDENRRRTKTNEKINRLNVDSNDFVCFWNECEEKFDELINLTKHLRDVHVLSMNRNEPFVCRWKKCSKTTSFHKRYLLERHLRIHTFEKPFQCDVCQKQFSTADRLRIHVRKHKGDRPYACKLCGKSFSASGDYCRHKKIHEKTSKYFCLVCKKLYKDDSGLRKHRKTCENNRISDAQVRKGVKNNVKMKKALKNNSKTKIDTRQKK